MRHRWSNFILLLALAASANAQITRTATFENYTEGQFFKPSFVDPQSGITFLNSTTQGQNFAIDYSSTEFGGGNYLVSNGYEPGPGSVWAADFGFTGDLPFGANYVGVGVTDGGGGFTAGLSLVGLDAHGSIVAQQSGAASEPDPFTLQISSAEYNIVEFKVVSNIALRSGYDNITYTILPEPAPISSLLLATSFPLLHRRRIRTSKTPSHQLES